MRIVDHDDRLVVLNNDATVAFVWSPAKREWVTTGEAFPRKAWLDGEQISKTEAKARFPNADWSTMPELERA